MPAHTSVCSPDGCALANNDRRLAGKMADPPARQRLTAPMTVSNGNDESGVEGSDGRSPVIRPRATFERRRPEVWRGTRFTRLAFLTLRGNVFFGFWDGLGEIFSSETFRRGAGLTTGCWGWLLAGLL